MAADILIIEDETILRELIASELEKSGYSVRTAADGEIGWRELSDTRPDLVLLDLLMPVMDGYEVLEKMRADAVLKEVPCIVISNSGQTDDLNRAFQCGANDVLIKANFDPDQVVHKIGQLLGETAPAGN